MFSAFIACAVLSAGTPVKVSGYRHTLVLLSSGEVVGWGRPDSGQLGPIKDIPVGYYTSKGIVKVKLPQRAKDITTGYETSVAVLEDGTVVAWGVDTANFMGGVRTSNNLLGSETPVTVKGLDHIVKVEAFNKTFVALKDNGDVYQWGVPSAFGDGSVGAKVPGLSNITAISIASGCMALDKAGHVFTWGGYAWSGMLGRLTNLEGVGIVPGLDNVASIACGNGVCLAAKKDGTVWAWGSNYQGQLGNGKRADAPVRDSNQNDIQLQPRQVPGIQGAVAVMSSNAGFGYALLGNGTLKGWGNTQQAQTTLRTNSGYLLSPATMTISGVKKAWAIGQNGYAVKADGSLWLWGGSFQGGFPFGKTTSSPVRLGL